MEEIWKEVKGYEGLYSISSEGRVKCVKRSAHYDQILKITKNKRSKGKFHYVKLCKDGKRTMISYELMCHVHFPQIFPLPKYPSRIIEGEEWKDVAEYEGYQVSNCGRIRTKTHYILTKAGVKKPRFSKVLKLSLMNSGYLFIMLHKDGNNRNVSVHRLVFEHFKGPIPDGYQINHINGVKTDNRIENLEMVTGKQNMAHAIATGLVNNRGENSSSAKLLNSQAEEIRGLYKAEKYNQYELADIYHVSVQAISNIVNNKTYKNENYKR